MDTRVSKRTDSTRGSGPRCHLEESLPGDGEGRLSPFADDGTLLAAIVDGEEIPHGSAVGCRRERCDDDRGAPRAALRSAADRLIFNARGGAREEWDDQRGRPSADGDIPSR